MKLYVIPRSILMRMGKKHRVKEQRNPYDGLRPWSAITHGIGAVLSVLGTLLLLWNTAIQKQWFLLVQFLIYGLSMICLYTASTLYHCINTSVSGRLALRKYDHCSIYLLIAGSYTPICLTVLHHHGGMALLTTIWTLAIAGVLLTLAKLDIPRWLTSTIYLVMGWLALFAIIPIYYNMPRAGFRWLLFGGILYSIGGISYALKWPGRNHPKFGCHEIFHLFILGGSICHYQMMLILATF